MRTRALGRFRGLLNLGTYRQKSCKGHDTRAKRTARRCIASVKASFSIRLPALRANAQESSVATLMPTQDRTKACVRIGHENIHAQIANVASDTRPNSAVYLSRNSRRSITQPSTSSTACPKFLRRPPHVVGKLQDDEELTFNMRVRI